MARNNTNRTPTAVIAIPFLLLALTVPGCQSEAPPPSATQNPAKRFNVVIIVADALRQDALSCYGGAARTPYIDDIAKNGAIFENAYSPAPWTAPSSVSMFTGNYATGYARTAPDLAQSEGVRVLVPHSEFLLMEALNQQGYRTEMAIENVNAILHNNLQGMQEYRQPGELNEILPPELVNQIHGITGADDLSTHSYVNAFIMLKQLLAIPPDQNFAFLLWMLDPHHPYKPPDKFKALLSVDPSTLSKPVEYYEDESLHKDWATATDEAYAKALYIKEIESVDERVGYVLRLLHHRGDLKNTYIIFTSDHGEQFGDHGIYGHGGFGQNCHFYEGLMEVPLLIVGPGIPPGTRVRENVSTLDLMPTLKDVLGMAYDETMQGRSLMPLLLGASREPRPLYFGNVQDDMQTDALLDGPFKLICLRDGSFELYDLSTDPTEMRNVAGDRPDRVKTMFQEVERLRTENQARRKRNTAALRDVDHLTGEARDKAIEQLRSLGYIR